MGMSNEMPPKYLTVTPSGQVTYILDANNISLAQVQLAVPASEVLLIQEEGKAVGLSNSPILLADVGAENLSLLGNNVIVLVSQAQEVMIVNSDISVDNAGQQWQEDSAGAMVPASLLPATHLMSNSVVANTEDEDEEWSSSAIRESSPNSTVENARGWFRDSVITTAALSSLSSYLQTHTTTKDG